ncbi:hypothetical protein EW145_g6110 [Phellinidium pouzarii]|uniref:Nucleoside transporter n=1 Tax=Phellinidium pouzarii TaxID=167371 RepID=A0A4S4KXY4_9AGAM|nr:hypothetical protein EW145_g6110 [Phellinidium pouzarii]
MSSSSPHAAYHSLPQTASVADEIQDEADVQELHILNRTHLDNRIRWVHFVFGCAVLLPWNALITATPYFLSRLSGTPLKSTFSSYLSITFTVANFSFLAHATLTSKQVHAVLVGLLTLSTTVTSSPSIFFAFVLFNAIVQAAAGSYLQTAVMAIASLFGPSAMQATMSGQAFVGVVVSSVQLLSAAASVRAAKLAASQNEDYDEGAAETRAAALFFGLSTLFLCATLGAQAWLERMPEYIEIVRPVDQAKRSESSLLGSESDETLDIKHEKGRIMRIAKANIEYEIAVAYVFGVTLAVFPPITASIQSTNPSSHPLLFTAAHFLIFNCGDLAGRYLCAIPYLLVWSSRRLLVLSFARTLFIPLFLLCNIRGSSPPPPLPGIPAGPLSVIADAPFISSDILFFLILLLFGLSNGYVASMCMMAAPSVSHNPRLHGRHADVDVAATIASFCLVGGLALGSAASFAVRARVCGCNPFTE